MDTSTKSVSLSRTHSNTMDNFTNTFVNSLLRQPLVIADVSDDVQVLVNIVVQCIMTQVVIILGIPGNIMNVLVFVRQGLGDRVTLLLFSLSLSDLLNLASCFLMNGACILPTDVDMNWRAALAPNVLQVNLFAAMLSNTLSALLSLDRCVTIAFPFKSRERLTVRHTLCAILFIVVFYMAFYLPTFIYYKVGVFDTFMNKTILYLIPNDIFLPHPNVVTARDTMHWTGGPLLFALVITCSIITLRKLREATKTRLRLTNSKLNAAETKITKMVLFVAMVMACCILPDLVVFCVHVTEPEFYIARKYHNAFLISQYFIFLASCVHSSANFYLYVIMSSKFYATLKTILGCEIGMKGKRIKFRSEASNQSAETKCQT